MQWNQQPSRTTVLNTDPCYPNQACTRCPRHLECPPPSLCLFKLCLSFKDQNESCLLQGTFHTSSHPTQRTEAATVLCKSIFIIQTEADPPKTRYPCHQNPSSTCTGLGPRNLSEYLLIVLLINLPLRDLPHKPTLHSVVPCP